MIRIEQEYFHQTFKPSVTGLYPIITISCTPLVFQPRTKTLSVFSLELVDTNKFANINRLTFSSAFDLPPHVSYKITSRFMVGNIT